MIVRIKVKKLTALILAIFMAFTTVAIVPVSTYAIAGHIVITTTQEFYDIRHNLGGSFILEADIDLSYFNNWRPINNFTGTVDGNGFTMHS